MKLSKILALLLSLVMLFSLFACDSSNKVDNTSTEEKKETTTSAGADSDTETDPTSESTTEPTSESTSAPDSETESDTESTTPPTPEVKVITIAEALALCGEEAGYISEERYEIHATIKTITNAQYGAMVIYDATGEISVYGTYSADGAIAYGSFDEKPYKGDDVVLHCILQNYNGTKEIQNARLISFTSNQGNFDASAYKDATIAEARAAAVGDKVKVSGTVAAITYANGMKPSGFILVNGADSIYVYNGDAAAMVSVGNNVTVAGSKTYWVLADEQNYAASFGYKGCNQLEDATVISNDKGNNDWVSTSVPTATVKELMDKPVSEDFTSQIYKATALVTKAPGNGFINYYINDLDGETGSYVYTQCNGGDFAWLDEFDGKICTVYFTVINAKSTKSGCVYRLLPVKVVDEGFTFNTDNAPEFAVKYHGLTQFGTSYSGNPELELITSVSSDLLGFSDVAVSYTSDNEKVIKIETVDGKKVMSCLESGTASITVTATFNGNSYSEKITITVNLPKEEVPSISVSEAIASDNGTSVTVKGIVGPSLINQIGFYLIDDSGVIAVLTDNATMDTLTVGNEVIIQGTRKLSKDTDGQICLGSSTVVQNNYGAHDYSTAAFITGKTVSNVTALDGDVSHTTEVYVVTGTIRQESTNFSMNTYVGDGTSELLLYAGGKTQYAWLTPYVGQEVTIELAVCDWNNKGNKGCVLSITLADGTKIINTYNFE